MNGPNGEQSPSAEDLELSRLRAEVERLKERLAFKEAERKHLAAIIKERDEKRLLLPDKRVAERQVWSKTRERLEAELARANNVAAAFERERDAAMAEAAVALKALEDLHAMVSRRGSCVGVAALLGCTADGIASMREGYAEAIEVEREACARVAELLPAQAGCDGGVQRILADHIAAAIRARGQG